MRGVFLETAAQRGEIPFRAVVAFWLNVMSGRGGRVGDV